MKSLIALSLLSLSASAFSADWKVVAETMDCSDKVQILAKDGEKFVQVKTGDKVQKLISQDGSAFSSQGGKSTVFVSAKKETHLGVPTYEYTHPSYQEANPPKIDIFYSGVKKHCKMSAK